MAWLRGVVDKAALWSRRPAEDPSGVLLVSSGGLGDTVLFALVLPRLLTLAKPGESVTVLLRSDAAKMAFLLPDSVNVLIVDYKRLGKEMGYRFETLRQMRESGFRLVVSTDYLRHPYLDEALVKACGAREAYAMEPRPWAKYDTQLSQNRALYTKLFKSGAPVYDKVLRWADFANWLTGSKAKAPKVSLAKKGLAAPQKLKRPTILVQPFSAVKAKQSPPAIYAALMQALPDYDFVLLGAPGDLLNNQEFQVLLDRGASFDTSRFNELVPLLRGADLVISVDTALMHLATAVGAQTLCLASAGYVGEIVPYADVVTPDNVTFLYHDMPCKGCLGACIHPLEANMFPCIACLDEGRVVTAVKNILMGKA